MDDRRVRILKDAPELRGPVVYWMSRDQRARDNWALIFAQEKAMELKCPLVTVFTLVPAFLGAAYRQYSFMIEALRETGAELSRKNIQFVMLKGDPADEMSRFAKKIKASAIVTDFDPLREKREWKARCAALTDVRMYEVDAHNIVPCWEASGKQEAGAYTLRPKIKKSLTEYLSDFPDVKRHPYTAERCYDSSDWGELTSFIKADKSVGPVSWIKPGCAAAGKALKNFIGKKLDMYASSGGRPDEDACSDLSPYLHFGQISAQRAALEVIRSVSGKENKDRFLEELIIRRELADNYCFYNRDYDSFEGIKDWAKHTLKEHSKDKREYVYTALELEKAATHDELWNASQKEMVSRGKMNSYMRMYWAKKILEWSRKPREAHETAVYLNDRYELDGRDPNGYAGIAWSIGGIHDRPWPERKIFGKIRYMSYKGCASKFDIKAYINKVNKFSNGGD